MRSVCSLPPSEQLPAGAIKSAFHSPGGTVENLRASLVGQALLGGEDENGAEGLWEGCDPALQFGHIAGLRQGLVWGGAGAGQGERDLLQGVGIPALAGAFRFVTVPAKIEGDPVKPGGEAPPTLVPIQGIPRAEKGVLANFLGVLFVAEPVEAEAVNGVLVKKDQFPEGGLAPGAGFGDERFTAIRGWGGRERLVLGEG
jgi:hypothetical protein